MKKIIKWIGIGFVVLVVIGAIAGGSGDKSNNTSSDSGSQKITQAEKNYTVGESISSDKLEIIVTNTEERSQVGNQYLNEKASEGATLLAVTWKVKNVSDKPVGSFSQPTIKLVDSNGTEYEWDLGKSSTYATEQDLDTKVLSDLNPGITTTGAKVFEISKEAFAQGGWKIKFQVSGKSYYVEL